MKLLNIFKLFEGPREDYVVDKLGHKLLIVAQGDRSTSKDVVQLVDQLSAMDPTNNKQYLQWIAKQYLNKLFRIEDASRIHEVLVNFNQLKPRLAKRDINQYTLHELEQEIDNIMQGGETDNMKQANYNEVADADYLYRGPLGTLVVPKTKEASCELGRGTKWCTAADKNNMFETYNKVGKLYIWIDRSGKKYQFWVDENITPVDIYAESEHDDYDDYGDGLSYDLEDSGWVVQAMDAQDRPLSSQELNQLAKIKPLQPILTKIRSIEVMFGLRDRLKDIDSLYSPIKYLLWYIKSTKSIFNNGKFVDPIAKNILQKSIDDRIDHLKTTLKTAQPTDPEFTNNKDMEDTINRWIDAVDDPNLSLFGYNNDELQAELKSININK